MPIGPRALLAKCQAPLREANTSSFCRAGTAPRSHLAGGWLVREGQGSAAQGEGGLLSLQFRPGLSHCPCSWPWIGSVLWSSDWQLGLVPTAFLLLLQTSNRKYLTGLVFKQEHGRGLRTLRDNRQGAMTSLRLP